MPALQMATSLRVFRMTRIFPDLTDTNENCCICLEKYGQGHRPVRVHFQGCMHAFGRTCLRSWLESGSTMSHCCPVCRMQWYTPRTEFNEPPSSSIGRWVAHLNPIRIMMRISESVAYRARNNGTNLITGLPPVTAVEAYLDSITQELTRLEGMEFVHLVQSPNVQDRLRYLEIRMEMLRQNIYDQRTSPGSFGPRTDTSSPSHRSRNGTVYSNAQHNGRLIRRSENRSFVGFLDQVQSR